MNAASGNTPGKKAAVPSPAWDDTALVEHCLSGDERAWEALLQKYKKLIYSVPLRYRFSAEDAADIFQAVCVDLFTQLDQVRNVEALRGWLVRVAANKCFHWKQRRENSTPHAPIDDPATAPADPALQVLPEFLGELEREQIVREGLARLTPRCRDMIRMLFFEEPPRPYEDVARDLGLATGSIGFIRGRCLKKLTQVLEELGL
jgi:RNA polymerase sigma factor (sigma-70 family)